MHLRHISPRSMDWLDAVFVGEEKGGYGGGQRGTGALREADYRPRSRAAGTASRRDRAPTEVAAGALVTAAPMEGASQRA